MENKRNHNGANQYTSDPREQTCWDNYIKTLTAGGKGNAMQSALKAGYSKGEAKNVRLREWFKERLSRLRRKDMLSKSERNLDEILDLKVKEGKRINPQLLNIKKDVSITIAKTLGKDKGYTERQELTGKDGERIIPIYNGQSNVSKYISNKKDIPTQEEN